MGGAAKIIFGSRAALLSGTVFTTAAFALLAVAHSHPYDLLISAGLLGVGIGLAFAALGNLIVQAVPPQQTGVATGMNTIVRTIGGAIGAEVAASILAANLLGSGQPAKHGYTITFWICAAVVAAGVVASLAVPGRRRSDAHVVTAARAVA